MIKICIKCELEFPETAEHFYRRGAEKLRNECKKCTDKRVREWKESNPERTRESIRKRGRKYYYKYHEKAKERGRTKSRQQFLNFLNVEHSFEDLLKQQNYCCKICSIELELNGQRTGNAVACVDHCHETNTYRGILCTSCNKGLGLFKDNVNLLLEAIKYLNERKENT